MKVTFSNEKMLACYAVILMANQLIQDQMEHLYYRTLNYSTNVPTPLGPL